eukprot:5084577-Pleurochrysis_carterae.AAC.1
MNIRSILTYAVCGHHGLGDISKQFIPDISKGGSAISSRNEGAQSQILASSPIGGCVATCSVGVAVLAKLVGDGDVDAAAVGSSGRRPPSHRP